MSARAVASRFVASERAGEVSALLLRPPEARALMVLAHGAGADMRHPFMESIAGRLAAEGLASFRFQFPYSEKGAGRPDPAPVLQATVRAGIEAARAAAGDLPLLAGGKSMGGRMTSLAAAESPLPGVRGIAFLGFPLHPAGAPSVERAQHLEQVAVPMLFLEGTRDPLADLELLRPLCERLGERARLHVVPDGDHSFHVLKRTGRSDDQVMDELARVIREWAETVLAGT